MLLCHVTAYPVLCLQNKEMEVKEAQKIARQNKILQEQKEKEERERKERERQERLARAQENPDLCM